MSKYVDADQLSAGIKNLIKVKKEKLSQFSSEDFVSSTASSINNRLVGNEEVLSLIDSLQQEQPEVDLERLKNKAELIANEIMMGVQANKYHTCIYDKASNDFNHSHLLRAALKGIELGLNARKSLSFPQTPTRQ